MNAVDSGRILIMVGSGVALFPPTVCRRQVFPRVGTVRVPVLLNRI